VLSEASFVVLVAAMNSARNLLSSSSGFVDWPSGRRQQKKKQDEHDENFHGHEKSICLR
jgi:hypothetical protein